MKKKMVLLGLAIIMSLVTYSTAFADTWEWTYFNLTWDMPSSFVVEQCDANVFAARDKAHGDFTVRIEPWNDASATVKDVCMDGFNSWGGWSDWATTSEGPLEHPNGFSGYYACGYGKQVGRDRLWTVIGFIDPNSSLNFFMRYGYDQSYENNYDVAIEIYNSLQ